MYRTTINDYAIESDYPNLRHILAEDYAYLSDAELEEELEPVLGDMSLEEYESFMSDLSRFGRSAGNVLSRAAPGALSGAISGATAGAALGPYGMLAGALGGAALGGYQSYQASRQPRPAQPQATQRVAATQPAPAAARPPSPMMPQQPVTPTPATARPVTAPATSTQGGSAAAQLLAVLTRPETLQALQAMMMSQRGRRSVQVGNSQVPVAAFSNLISTLAQRSAAQQNAVVAREAQATPEYLTNDSGEFICDPMDAEQRADVLLSLLQAETESYAFDDDFEDEEYEDFNEDYEDFDDEDEDFDDEDNFDMEDEDDDELLWEEELEELLA